MATKNKRKGRVSEEVITRRGLAIYQKGGQIKAISKTSWDVASQNTEGKQYRVSFATSAPTCECRYHSTGNGSRCKHISAVEHLMLAEAESSHNEKVIIREQKLACPKCNKTEYVRNGKEKTKSGEKQRYLCKNCGRRFRDNLGFEGRHTAPVYITLSLMLYGAGMSIFNAQVILSHMGVNVHVDTIARWIEHFTGMVEEYTNPIQPPCLGDKLGADEKHEKIKGEENYFVMAMDLATRFILAWETMANKPDYKATNLLQMAKAKAGKTHRIFITDGLSGYHIAFKKVIGIFKGFTMHIRDIHIRNKFCNTNKQERINSTFAGRCKLTRGINKENSLIYHNFVLHYNYVRPHSGIGGRTPAEAAGIIIQGNNKWLTLIQNAAIAT